MVLVEGCDYKLDASIIPLMYNLILWNNFLTKKMENFVKGFRLKYHYVPEELYGRLARAKPNKESPY